MEGLAKLQRQRHLRSHALAFDFFHPPHQILDAAFAYLELQNEFKNNWPTLVKCSWLLWPWWMGSMILMSLNYMSQSNLSYERMAV